MEKEKNEIQVIPLLTALFGAAITVELSSLVSVYAAQAKPLVASISSVILYKMIASKSDNLPKLDL